MNNLFLTSFFYSKTDPGEIDAVHIVLGHKIIKGRKRFSKKGKNALELVKSGKENLDQDQHMTQDPLI